MSHQPAVALVTCSAFPGLDAYDAVLLPRLNSMGIAARAVVWDDPAVDWDAFDLCVVRSTWDYASRRDEFLAWAWSVPRLANPAAALEWNTDKHYLADLEKRGVPVVATTWLEPGQGLRARGLHTRMPALGDFVLKPAVSAGSVEAGRYTANDSYARGEAIAHALRLLEAGQSVMLQRYLPSVDTKGETSMVFLDGRYAYAVRKNAMLTGPVSSGRMYQAESLAGGHQPSDAELAVANAAIEAAAAAVAAAAVGAGEAADAAGAARTAGAAAAVAAGEAADAADGPARPLRPFLYARADLVQRDDGQPVLLELELTEPALFPELAVGGIELVCRAIAGRLSPV
ncbi:MAG: hypothetical protein LBD77_10055 [Bifidobacteriaceae bacterium]|nr:hypothetical protein [Bifidobacteriaceae bacterium]